VVGNGGAGTYAGGKSIPIPNEFGGSAILGLYPYSFSGRDLEGNLITSGGSGGGSGSMDSAGGNSSGPIIINAAIITGTGTISSRGGTPSAASGKPAGGGSSSFVVLNYYENRNANYTIDVTGGSGVNGGSNGSDGVVYFNQML
jgi:hypothetical protein